MMLYYFFVLDTPLGEDGTHSGKGLCLVLWKKITKGGADSDDELSTQGTIAEW